MVSSGADGCTTAGNGAGWICKPVQPRPTRVARILLVIVSAFAEGCFARAVVGAVCVTTVAIVGSSCGIRYRSRIFSRKALARRPCEERAGTIQHLCSGYV